MISPFDAVDFEPLTRPVDASAVRESERRLGRTAIRSRVGDGVTTGCVTGIVVVVGVLFAGAFAMGPLSGGSPWWWLPCGIVLALTALLIAWIVRRVVHAARTGPEVRWRLTEFFAANGIQLVLEVPDPDYRSTVFGEGRLNPRLVDVTRWFDGAVEVGQFRYLVPGYRGARSPQQWGYARMPLTPSAPDLLLDAASNNAPWKAGALTGIIDVREPTKLVAANGARFTLWAWRRDLPRATALADQEFVDLLSRFPVDLEITGGVAYLYWDMPLQFADEERWRWIFAVAESLRTRVG
ncbi:hypothetical protein [Microbacterium sp. ZW T5_56]|uniref:hypothetical protein n=1 Tax=Microbacterium sp. ZW T5_56 TaxID=3378081 RepID=UPI00385222D7